MFVAVRAAQIAFVGRLDIDEKRFVRSEETTFEHARRCVHRIDAGKLIVILVAGLHGDLLAIGFE